MCHEGLAGLRGPKRAGSKVDDVRIEDGREMGHTSSDEAEFSRGGWRIKGPIAAEEGFGLHYANNYGCVSAMV